MAVDSSLRIHDVRMRLLAFFDRRFGIVDRPLTGVPIADFLFDECFDQVTPLRDIEFARQGNFDLPVRGPVFTLVGVGSTPEMLRVVLGPFRHVAGVCRFQIFVAFAPFVLALALDVFGCLAAPPLPPTFTLQW